MSKDTFDYWLHFGLWVSFLLTTLCMALFGRIYYRHARHGRIFPSYVLVMLFRAWLFAGFFLYVTVFESKDQQLVWDALLAVAFGGAVEAVISGIFGMIITRGRLR